MRRKYEKVMKITQSEDIYFVEVTNYLRSLKKPH